MISDEELQRLININTPGELITAIHEPRIAPKTLLEALNELQQCRAGRLQPAIKFLRKSSQPIDTSSLRRSPVATIYRPNASH